MKTKFTPNEIMSNRGCYERSDVKKLSFIGNSEISIDIILNSEIPIKDKFWFLLNNCEFTPLQKKLWFIGLAEITLEIYENKYPNNKAPREAIQAAKDYLNNLISRDELIIKRKNAYAAADAAYAAYAAADDDADTAVYAADDDDADTAAYTAAYAAYAAAADTAVYDDADAVYAAYAVYAAAAADWETKGKRFQTALLVFTKEFINSNL